MSIQIRGENLKKYIAFNLIFNMVYSVLFIIFVCGNEERMTPWWITLLAAIIPTVITCFVTLYCSKKTYINQNTEEMKKFARQMGLDDNQSLAHRLSQQNNNILKDIGKTDDDKTLTGQHKELQKLIEREIETVERRYIEDEKRIEHFGLKQKNISKTIDDFHIFTESWKRLAAENPELKRKIRKLEQENKELKRENELLKQQNTVRKIRR